MSTRTEALVEGFEQINRELVAIAEQCSDSDWQTLCLAEGWPVGLTIHHVANGYDQEGWVALLIQAVADEQPLPAEAPQDYNEWLQRYANCTQQETIDQIDRNSDAAVSLIRSLSDEQLDRTYISPSTGMPRTTEQLIQRMLIDHASEHLASIQATIKTNRHP
jgi:hypothetical protein